MAAQGENLVERAIAKAIDAGREGRVALCEGTQSLTYGELAEKVRKTAAALQAKGVKTGDRVAVYSPDCMDSALGVLGAMYAGAIALPISELSAANDLRNRLNNATASIVLVHHTLRPVIEEVRTEVESLKELITLSGEGDDDFGLLVATSDALTEPPAGGDDPALLLYSASAANNENEVGSRGVLHSHATAIRAFESFAGTFMSMTHEDRVFSTVRLSTAYGLGTGLLFPLLAGAQCLLVPEQPHSALVFDAIRDFKPTVFAATPSLYGQMARDAVEGPQGKKPLSEVRWCLAGAESIPPKVIAMTRAVLGNNVTVGYGLTEAFQFVIAGAAAGRRQGFCGSVLDGIEVRIIDDEGKEVGVDEIGNLELRGKNVVNAYWGSDAAEMTEDGWFKTRDRFMVDEDKNFYHCGRVDQLFKVGGKWVAPAEVERALLANEAVWECAVIGADDEDGLIKPFAFIVPNIGQVPGAELEAELREYVKQELAPYKYPRWIEFIDELPKAPSGVILRFKLMDRLKESIGRRHAEKRSDSE
jgi:benzoate-CoA ligase